MRKILFVLAVLLPAFCFGCGFPWHEEFPEADRGNPGEDFSWPVAIELEVLREDERIVYHDSGLPAARLTITNLSDQAVLGGFRVSSGGHGHDGGLALEPMEHAVKTVPVPFSALEGRAPVRVSADCGAGFGVFRRVRASFDIVQAPPVEVKVYPLRLDSVLAEVTNMLEFNDIDVSLEVFSGEAEAVFPVRKTRPAPGERVHFKYIFSENLPHGSRVEASARWGEEFGPGESRYSLVFDRESLRRIGRVDFPVIIDGDLSEWEGREHIFLGEERDVFPRGESRAKWRGPGDCSARLYLGWDEKYFYIAAAVSDDSHFNLKEGGAIWDGDSLQFAVARAGAGETNIGLALAAGAPRLYQWAGRDAAGKAEYAAARCGAAGKTYYEFRAPLEAFSLEPVPGVIFGFNAVVFDDDDGEGHDYWLQLSPGLAGGWDPRAFQLCVLED